MVILREYQESGVNAIRNAYIEGYRNVLYVLPTGGGKTVVFAHIAKAAVEKGNRVLILAHRIELIKQTSKKLKQNGVVHGIINRKFDSHPKRMCQVASVQTLVNRLDEYGEFNLIIVDEAHHATAGSWMNILSHYSKARVLGVTATPCRTDGKGLGKQAGGIFDNMILGPSIKELINMSYLVKPVLYAPSHKIDMAMLKEQNGDYTAASIEAVMNKREITGKAVELYSQICPHTPTIVFCGSVKHAEDVAMQFRESGWKAYNLDGTTHEDKRNAIINGLEDGSVEILCSCDVVSEGTDIPNVGCVILLRPTASEGLYLQQVGRGLRVIEGKTQCIILDQVGNSLRHLAPDEERTWTLEGKEKKKREKKGEKQIKLKQCDKCYMFHLPAPQCPECKYVYPVKSREIEENDGTLILMTDQVKEILKKQKQKQVNSARTKEELEEIARKRGYKPAWVHKMLKVRNK